MEKWHSWQQHKLIVLKQKDFTKKGFFEFEFNLIKTKTLSKSLFFGQYSPFLCFLSCGCQATGQQFFFDFASGPQGWREEGDTVKALWGQCVPTPGLVSGWPPAVLMAAPPDGRLAEAPHGIMACGQSMLPFRCRQSGAAHSEAQGRTDKQPWRHGPPCAVCVSVAKTRLL